MKYLLLGLIVSALISSSSVSATNMDMKLEIAPQACTLDTLSTGASQSTTLQPEVCRTAHDAGADLPGIPSTTELTNNNTSVDSSPEIPPSAPDSTPGNQHFFEETIFEELAAWLGVGNNNAPTVQPMVTSIGVVTGMGLLVDSMFFKLRYTKLVRRLLHQSASFTFGRTLRGVARILRIR